ncbi:hypothetical protein P5704_024610 (plasmid) [Pseudomonas sp. FeN3W]|nr:hypothetical protein P5704_024610 [Pseudomonas sp. FeN3W]
MKSNNIIAKTARLESAIELLAEETGKVINLIVNENETNNPNKEKIEALEKKLSVLRDEKRLLSVENVDHVRTILKKYSNKTEEYEHASGL